MVFLICEEDLYGVGILYIWVDLVRINRIAAVERRVAGDTAHLLLDEGNNKMPKSDSGEGDWKGGEYLRNGYLELAERVHVQ